MNYSSYKLLDVITKFKELKNMKRNIDEYFQTLSNLDVDLQELVDYNKVFYNVDKLKHKLEKLNYLISNDKDVFFKKLDKLFLKDNRIFNALPALVAKRWDKNTFNNYDIEYIKKFFIETKLIDVFCNGKITNIVDYMIGVEVGLDTNARKNRSGKNNEILLEKKIRDYFSDYSSFIDIEIQKNIEIISSLNNKKFDFIITNKQNNKKIIIESSFYTAGGSKIFETSRSYLDVYKKISEYNNSKIKLKFLWIADGQGMKTIKSQIIRNYDLGYITNLQLLEKELSWILE